MLVTLGVGAAAVNTGNNLLYLVLGMLLSIIVLSGVLSELVLRRIRVERRLPRRAFAGSPALVELVVRNDKARLPSMSIEAEDVAPGEPCDRRCYFLRIDARGEQVATYQRTPRKRGVLRFTEVVLRTRYPFGLFEKSRVVPLDGELVVYPALVRHARIHASDERAGADVPTARRGPGTEVAGVREYQSGDDARAIHWRRSASLDRLVVRERAREVARRVTLLVDERRPEGADAAWAERFEDAISRAAASAARALEEGAAVEVVARSGASPLVLPGQPPDPLWRFLALLEPIEGDDGPELPTRLRGAVQRFDAGRGAA